MLLCLNFNASSYPSTCTNERVSSVGLLSKKSQGAKSHSRSKRSSNWPSQTSGYLERNTYRVTALGWLKKEEKKIEQLTSQAGPAPSHYVEERCCAHGMLRLYNRTRRYRTYASYGWCQREEGMQRSMIAMKTTKFLLLLRIVFRVSTQKSKVLWNQLMSNFTCTQTYKSYQGQISLSNTLSIFHNSRFNTFRNDPN